MYKVVPVLASVLLVAGAVAGGCAQPAPESEPAPSTEEGESTLSLSSPAFPDGREIPARCTCEGENVSPALGWGDAPAGTDSFALVVDDPDAPGGVFTHWVLFNLPPDVRELREGIAPEGKLPGGALQGKNDFAKVGYSGPCPPAGAAHHYRFTLYAVDKSLNLSAGASREQLLEAMQGHILARGQLVGTYQR